MASGIAPLEQIHGLGYGERRQLEARLGVEPQRLPRGCQEARPRRTLEPIDEQRRDRGDDLLEVVEHDQHSASGPERRDDVGRRRRDLA
jgi:hypothetical protein